MLRLREGRQHHSCRVDQVGPCAPKKTARQADCARQIFAQWRSLRISVLQHPARSVPSPWPEDDFVIRRACRVLAQLPTRFSSLRGPAGSDKKRERHCCRRLSGREDSARAREKCTKRGTATPIHHARDVAIGCRQADPIARPAPPHFIKKYSPAPSAEFAAPVGKGKAPIGKGKGKGPPPPVVTNG